MLVHDSVQLPSRLVAIQVARMTIPLLGALACPTNISHAMISTFARRQPGVFLDHAANNKPHFHLSDVTSQWAQCDFYA
jgi:hypothetical protein